MHGPDMAKFLRSLSTRTDRLKREFAAREVLVRYYKISLVKGSEAHIIRTGIINLALEQLSMRHLELHRKIDTSNLSLFCG